METQSEPRGPKASQGHPKGSQGHPRGSQREPQDTPKGGKGTPKVTKGPQIHKTTEKQCFLQCGMSPKSGNGLFPGKKKHAAIPTARKMLKYVKNTYCSCWTCSKIQERPFSRKKKTPAAIPTARKMLKIHKNIWTHTQTHLDKYTNTFGQIHKNIWKHTRKHNNRLLCVL